MPEQNSTEQTVNISPALFKHGSMILCEIALWSGSATPSDDDLSILGIQNFDKTFFKKGPMTLVSPEALKPFASIKGKAMARIESYGKATPFGKVMLIQHDDFKEHVRPFLQEMKADFFRLVDDFCFNLYSKEREQRINLFNERHPDHAGKLDRYFPAPAAVRKSYNFFWSLFEIKDVAGLDEVFQEEAEELRGKMRNFVYELAGEFRKTATSAALAFRKGIDRAKGKVDARAIDSFKEFLDRIEREDFLGDKDMRAALEDMKTKVFSIKDWTVKDQKSLDEVRQYLDEVVRIGEQEGASSAVATSFLREVSAETQMEIEVTDQQMGADMERVDLTAPAPDLTEPAEEAAEVSSGREFEIHRNV